MITKKILGRASGSLARRLLLLHRKCSGNELLGAIRVSNKTVTDLRSLGRADRPGVTKAGRLSLVGICEGRKVKVYSGYSRFQNKLRQDIQSIEFRGCQFPELIAVDDDLVVEAWVEGALVSELKGTELHQGRQAVELFLNSARGSVDMLDVVKEHGKAFCYFSNYLLPRLEVWRRWSLIEEFLMAWHVRYDQLRECLPIHFSHPDLSAANIIREKSTGHYFIIDNELIGVGHGWLLDGRNSFLGSDLSRNMPNDFVDLSWRLRQIGSALDAGDMPRVAVLCKGIGSGI